MIKFEHPEDQEYFKSILFYNDFQDFNEFQDMFDFRSPKTKRKEFNKIKNQRIETLKSHHGLRCMLQLECCNLETGIVVDHLIPISSNKLNKELRHLKAEKGKKVMTQSLGSNHIDNLILACNNCNNRKKHRILDHNSMKSILKEKRRSSDANKTSFKKV